MERRQAYGGVLAVVGVVLAAVQVTHALAGDNDPVVVVVEAVPLTAVALAFAVTGVWLARRGAYEADLPRIAAWAAGGALAFVSVAALTLFDQNVATGDLVRAGPLAVDNITVGATSGLLVGLYDARSRRRRRELEAERDRVEAFAAKAADVNNYGRAIASCDAVSGVSAFCIQAVATLLGVRETAFVEVADGAMRVVGDTTVGLPRADLRALADDAVEEEVGSVVVRDGTDRTAMTVLVTERKDLAVAMVAVADDADPVAEEDRQLLELLVSHAGATLDGIYATGERT